MQVAVCEAALSGFSPRGRPKRPADSLPRGDCGGMYHMWVCEGPSSLEGRLLGYRHQFYHTTMASTTYNTHIYVSGTPPLSGRPAHVNTPIRGLCWDELSTTFLRHFMAPSFLRLFSTGCAYVQMSKLCAQESGRGREQV